MRKIIIPLVGTALLISACTDTNSTPNTPTSATTAESRQNERDRNTGSEPQNGSISTRPTTDKADSQRTQGNRDKLQATRAPDATGFNSAAMTNPLQKDNADTTVSQSLTSQHNSTATPAAISDNAESAIIPQREASSVREAVASPNDNSQRNMAEDGSKPTPLDQGENNLDLGITKSIRSILVERSDLSVNAKNSKIITRDGVVTLRGPVADVRERDFVGATANAQAGVKRVDNQLEPALP